MPADSPTSTKPGRLIVSYLRLEPGLEYWSPILMMLASGLWIAIYTVGLTVPAVQTYG